MYLILKDNIIFSPVVVVAIMPETQDERNEALILLTVYTCVKNEEFLKKISMRLKRRFNDFNCFGFLYSFQYRLKYYI